MIPERGCGTLGCHEDGEVVARHPDRGELVLCREHAETLEVVRRA